jgi:hypothetical protein
MHIGESLIATAATSVYSPWFPRGSDNAIFTFETIASFGTPGFTVDVYHRNADEAGNGAAATGVGSWTTVGTTFQYRRYDNLKEMVRFKFNLAPTGTSGVLYRMLDPTWFNKASS